MSSAGYLELFKVYNDCCMSALNLASGNKEDPEYLKMCKEYKKILNKGRRDAKKQTYDGEPTKHQKDITNLDLHNKDYTKKLRVFANSKLAKEALRNRHQGGSDVVWLTPASGLHGSNSFRSFHGGGLGCFKIMTEDRAGQGEATIFAANDNDENMEPVFGEDDGEVPPEDDEQMGGEGELHTPAYACISTHVTRIHAHTFTARKRIHDAYTCIHDAYACIALHSNLR